MRTGETFAATSAFGGAQQWKTSWEHTYTTAEYLELMLTMGPIALLGTEQITALLEAVGGAIDAAGGRFTMQYDTLAVAVTRT